MNTTRITVFIGSLYLIVRFVASLSPPAEAQSSSVAALSMLLTFGMIVGLIGWLFGEYSNASKTGEKVSAGGIALPVVGLLAALGLLFNQLFGPRYAELPPRPATSSSTATQSTPIPSSSTTDPTLSRANRSRDYFYGGVKRYEQMYAATKSTRWMQSPDTTAFNPAGISKLDVRDFQKTISDMVPAVDNILTKLSDLDAAQAPMSGEVRKFWEAERQIYSGILQQVSLLAINWSEWSPNGFNPKDPALKAWQKQVVQLQAEIERHGAAAKDLKDRIQAEERVQSKTIPSSPKSIQSSTSPLWSPYQTEPTASLAKSLLDQFAVATSSYNDLYDVTRKTRWMQNPDTSVFRPGGISIQDLRNFQLALRNTVAAVDNVLTKWDELKAANVPTRSEVRELWVTVRQILSETLEQLSLLEANWSEWYPNGFSKIDSDLKPWQKKILQLQQEADRNVAAVKKLKERIQASESAR